MAEAQTSVPVGFDLALASASPERLAGFYRDVLGAAAIGEAEPWGAVAAVGFGAQAVAIRAAIEPERSSPRGIYAGVGLRVLALFVADIDACCARLEQAGRRVAIGVDLPGKLAVRFARDPDGNTLELIGLQGGAVPPNPLQVGLTVRDEAASCAFYSAVPGLRAQPPAPISPGITRRGFDVGHATLKLWQPLGGTAELPASRAGAIGIDAVLLRLAGRADDVAPAALVDPDGNRLEWISR